MTPIVERYCWMRWDRRLFTCWEAARRIKLDAGAGDIGARPGGLETERQQFRAIAAGDARFVEISAPRPWCLVLFSRKNAAHVGVWTGETVAHLSKSGGVRNEPVRDAMRFMGYLKASYHDLEDCLH